VEDVALLALRQERAESMGASAASVDNVPWGRRRSGPTRPSLHQQNRSRVASDPARCKISVPAKRTTRTAV